MSERHVRPPAGATRRGTVLILCIAIVITLTVVAYAFLRVAQMHNETSDSMIRQVLAREAATTGAQHAIEQIIREYVVPADPTNPDPTKRFPSFTRLDGAARAPFLSLNKSTSAPPRSLTYCPGGDFQIPLGNIGLNDSQTERIVTESKYSFWWDCYGDATFGNGNTTYDGRGRFYEPNFYNKAVTDLTSTAPTVPTPFGQSMTLTDPLPDRDDGIFYDEHWRRLTDDPRIAREKARYRLRYSVGVADLDGAILVNPDPGFDYRKANDADPRAWDPAATALSSEVYPYPPYNGSTSGSQVTIAHQGADPVTARVVRYQNAMANLALAHGDFGWGSGADGQENGFASVTRLEHIYLERGMAANFDRDPTKGNVPQTFPLMYRAVDDAQFFMQWQRGYYAPVSGPPWAVDLFHTTAGSPAVLGAKAGAEPIPRTGRTMRRSLMGPQYSFKDIDFSTIGGYGDGMWQQDSMVTTGTAFTPFGRGLSLASGTSSRFKGPVDTPFCVNVMTAPTRVVYAMIGAYMPPCGVAAFYPDRSSFPGPNTPTPDPAYWGTGQPGRHPNDPRYYFASATHHPFWSALLGQRDLFVAPLSPAFATYPAPARQVPSIVPDYHLPSLHPTDPAYRKPDMRYPGPIAFNGYDLNDQWRFDSLGMYLRAVQGNSASLAAWGGPAAGAPNPDKVEYMNPDMRGGAGWSFDPHIANGTSRNGAAVGFWYRPQLWGGTGSAESSTPGSYQYNSTTHQWESGNSAGSQGTGFLAPLPAPVPGTGSEPRPTTGTEITFGMTSYGPHPYSIWDAVGQAMGQAVMIARAQWMQYATSISDPAKLFDLNPADPAGSFTGGPWPDPSTRVRTIKDIDALFLANLGIDINNPTSTSPTTAYYSYFYGWPSNFGIKAFTPAWNLASLRTQSWFSSDQQPGYIAGDPIYTPAQRTAIMELIINDMRLSFFGSSPGYDDFRPLDLDGDGVVHCSGYPSSGSSTELALRLDQHAGPGTPVTNYFSNSGVFFMGKSRFWEIITRGEVVDNMLKTTMSEAILDTVICIDPVDKANELALPSSQDPSAGQYSSHVIHQRWYYDKYRGHLSRKY